MEEYRIKDTLIRSIIKGFIIVWGSMIICLFSDLFDDSQLENPEGSKTVIADSNEVLKLNSDKDLLVESGENYYLIKSKTGIKQKVSEEDRIMFKYKGKDLEGKLVSIDE